ncbi:MAG: GtrA family protein [Candidatus Promineifilaceae bacterium]
MTNTSLNSSDDGLLATVAGRFGVNPVELTRFLKFVVVGSIGFIVDFGTLTVLVEAFGINELIANVFSFTAAVISNFLFNRYWTYPDSRSKDIWQQLIQFSLVNIVGLGINTLVLFLLIGPFNRLIELVGFMLLDGRGYIPAKICGTVIVLFWNFFVNRYWTYNDVD